VPDQLADENPPESLKEILDKRMDKVTPAPINPSIETHPYRRAIGGGVLAALLFLLLAGTIFVIKSLAK